MRRGRNRLVRFDDSTIGPDQVRVAERIIGVTCVDHAVRFALYFVERQQRERVTELVAEGAVGVDRVEARAENDDVLGLEVADSITESVALDRSTRGVRRWVEPEKNVLACEVRKPDA
jgi:hypothetical protein